ncbi:hemicentin-1-like [Uloborus diversus]|uniref:hemicentin-1-like n=1 Tax=Uloborus diversus TaxID=327109 RepID=UPI00240A6F17|nr:hemicentin-1-like [Uloborus diversus]
MRRRLRLKFAFPLLPLLIMHVTCTELPETFVEGLEEGSAKMPCEVGQRKDDNVEFIFWYKNEGVTAIYTLDSRGRDLSQATHMRNETYSDRLKFDVTGDVPLLELDDLREEDSGSYFCRIDYQWTATEIKRVNLVVVVLPKSVVIRDDSGEEVGDIAGPYKEKSDVSFTCDSQKGFPLPNVTWWKNNKLWDATFKKSSTNVINEMRLSNLSRLDLFTTFHCKAQNTKLTSPMTKSLVVDMYLYPLSVKITSRSEALSAGKSVDITCESKGSRPSAKVTWWLNGSQLTDHVETVRENSTSSVLRLLPKVQHHKWPLVCRAQNPMMKDSILEDTRILNVTYVPQVTLRLMKEEADRQPKEGDFVRLSCDVEANPQVLKVGWLLDDLPLSHNESRTDTPAGNTLVFKRIALRNRGRYRCYAINEEGRGVSRELTLNISHAPVCKPNQQITYVVGLNESAVIRCEVEADPADVTFRWEFSNTVRKHYHLMHSNSGVVSRATYTPTTPADYGTLFCWANNSVGHQQSSCFFTVIAPACKPEKTTKNASTSSRDGSEEVWNHSAITAGACIIASIIIVTAVCVFYFRKFYLEKKHRPMGWSTVQVNNSCGSDSYAATNASMLNCSR